MPEQMEREPWTNWSDERPPNEPGVYWWRVDPREIDGVTWRPEWTEEMHLCGMGYRDSEYWPIFARWDGYRRTPPNGLQWRSAVNDKSEKLFHHGLDLDGCPFCAATPELKWTHRASSGGVYIGSSPYEANEFRIICTGCGIASTHYSRALGKLIASWNRRATRPADEGVRAELQRLRRENMLLKADGGPMIMALLADADVYDPTDEQVEFANSVRRPDRSWNDEVRAIREHYSIPEPEIKPKKKRRAALKGDAQ